MLVVRGSRVRGRLGFVLLMGVLVLAAACGSSGSSKASPGTAAPNPATPTTINAAPAQGVTANAIKVGVMMIDFDCVKQFVDSLRPDQEQAYRIYFDDIN